MRLIELDLTIVSKGSRPVHNIIHQNNLLSNCAKMSTFSDLSQTIIQFTCHYFPEYIMPSNVVMDEAELNELEEGGGLKSNTVNTRARQFKDFCEFVKQKSDGSDLHTLMMMGEDGRNTVVNLMGLYFFTMRVLVDGKPEWPKKGYAEKIRSSIKMSILNEYKVDITDQGLFPEAGKKWKSFCDKLAKEGRAETSHHPEVDPVTMEAINNLGTAVIEALKARGTDDYESKLSKIPFELRNKLNYVLQWLAMKQLVLFEVRRGAENMNELKKEDFVIYEDPIKKFKYINHIKSERDKNHPDGTNSAMYGVIPFLDFASNYNPGEIFSFYMQFLPDKATKEGCKGGFLFPKPRIPSQKFDPHDPNEMCLYEPNQRGDLTLFHLLIIRTQIFLVGKNYIYDMLPRLTDAVKRPRQTNHSLR